MRRARLTAAAAATLTLTLTLVSCGDGDETADPDPSGPKTSAEPTETTTDDEKVGPPCDAITDEQLTTWAGTTQTVTGPKDQGLRTECGTVRDADDSLQLTWSFQEPTISLAELLEWESDSGLTQQRIRLDGDVPAVLMTGDYVGNQLARVLTKVDAGLLIVEAYNTALGEPRPDAELVRIATQLASAYAG